MHLLIDESLPPLMKFLMEEEYTSSEAPTKTVDKDLITVAM